MENSKKPFFQKVKNFFNKTLDSIKPAKEIGELQSLTISNLHKTFNIGTVNEKIALRDVNLTINRGDFITVIGGNGAGKSTLLNMISGVFDADDGSIILNGNEKSVNITNMAEHKRAIYFGRVFQDPMIGTCAGMEIQENLALAHRRGKCPSLMWAIKGNEKDEYKTALRRLDLGLEDRLTSKVGLLSGGQRQALTLLMATLKAPKVLLLDEHTAALDPKTAANVLKLTQELASENNLTTFMITHNMTDAITYGNRLIMMHEGQIVYDVSGKEKQKLKVADLLKKFVTVTGELSDKMALSN